MKGGFVIQGNMEYTHTITQVWFIVNATNDFVREELRCKNVSKVFSYSLAHLNSSEGPRPTTKSLSWSIGNFPTLPRWISGSAMTWELGLWKWKSGGRMGGASFVVCKYLSFCEPRSYFCSEGAFNYNLASFCALERGSVAQKCYLA